MVSFVVLGRGPLWMTPAMRRSVPWKSVAPRLTKNWKTWWWMELQPPFIWDLYENEYSKRDLNIYIYIFISDLAKNNGVLMESPWGIFPGNINYRWRFSSLIHPLKRLMIHSHVGLPGGNGRWIPSGSPAVLFDQHTILIHFETDFTVMSTLD